MPNRASQSPRWFACHVRSAYYDHDQELYRVVLWRANSYTHTPTTREQRWRVSLWHHRVRKGLLRYHRASMFIITTSNPRRRRGRKVLLLFREPSGHPYEYDIGGVQREPCRLCCIEESSFKALSNVYCISGQPDHDHKLSHTRRRHRLRRRQSSSADIGKRF